jgi:hypothetical protein
MVLFLGLAFAAAAARWVDPLVERRPWADALLLLPVALVAADIAHVSRVPFTEAFWMRKPDVIQPLALFEHRTNPPLRYKRPDWAPPMLLAMMANTGVIACYGLDPSFVPAAVAADDPRYRGLTKAQLPLTECLKDTVARFLESGQPPLVAYRARRHLEASSRGGKVKAQLNAWTTLLPDGTFSFEVTQESGSRVIRERVLRAALLEEQENHASARLAESAFTRENYEFLLDNTVPEGELVRIGLAPRRKREMLIAGAAFVRRDNADLVTIQGVLSKRPSFWTRKVQMTRHYARIDGVRVPIEVQLDADVMLVGDSSFAMTYQYTAINGRQIATN